MNRVAKWEDHQRKEVADWYKELLEKINLSDYTKYKHIQDVVGMSSRTWRYHVENILHLYMYGYLDKVVISSSKGYILTDDKHLIKEFIIRKRHQFKALAYNAYNLEKALSQSLNMTIDEFIGEAIKEV